MAIPLLDLQTQYRAIREEIRHRIDEVCDAQSFILGKAVQDFEKEIACYCDVNHACGVNSGSDALLLSLMCEGSGPGEEVITSPYTFFATGGAISRTGATPVFVDICPDSITIMVA